MKQALKPSLTLLYWLGALAGMALLLGIGSTLTPVADELGTLFWVLLLALVTLAALDGYRLLRLPSPQLHRRVQGSLALGRWSEVGLQLTHDYSAPITVQVFDHPPDGLEYEHLPQAITLQVGQHAELGYRVRPRQRGLLQFERCELYLPSPMGLWSSRRYVPLAEVTHVYPDFARLYGGQLLAVDNWLSQIGVRLRHKRGLGMEFNQLREFREGDSLRQIDWKATARHRTPIAREYQEERDQQIMFMLDCGRRMRSQDGDLSHFDHALNALLLLGYVALRQGDAVGLSTFASEQPRYLQPVRGQGQLNVLLNSVYDLHSSQRPADYSAAVRQLLARQKRRALVVLMTNVRDEDDEELLAAVKQLERQHRVLVVSLREQVLDDLRHAPIETFDQALTYCGAVDFLNARAALQERLSAHGVALLDARPAELGAELVSRYLSWKKAGTL
ncbi:putative transmembrane protein [Paucimonas lemoignei]|nr:putative transmembrane protein [Paucimonas lemoignei]